MRFVKQLFILQTNEERGSAGWIEAVANAFMTWKRYDEASEYYKYLVAKNGLLLERTFLTAARDCPPFKLQYPKSTSEICWRETSLELLLLVT